MKKNNQLFLTIGIAVALAGITAATALPRPTLADTTAAIASGTAYLQSQPLDPYSIMALAATGNSPTTSSVVSVLNGSITTSTATDVEKAVLAITATGQDPRNFNGQNYLSDLENFYSTSTNDLNGASVFNNDIFGLLALSSAGVPSTNPIIMGTRSAVLANQNHDGGWGWATGQESDSNDTASVLWALLATGSNASDTAIQNGLSYLKTLQNSDGGFTFDPVYGTSTDAASDAWVISAIGAARQSPTSSAWSEGTSTPVSSLLSLQDASGSFPEYSDTIDTTSYAIIALLGKTLPVNTIVAPTSTPPLTVTITPSSLPDATAGSAYNETITAGDANASDTFTWTIATDTLSSSFTVTTSSTAGVSITGTPGTAGTYNISLTATSNVSSTNSSTVNYVLTVDAAPATQSSSGGGGGNGGNGGGGGGASTTGVQVSYRIEGSSGDLCDGQGTAVTAIDVLTDASSLCGTTYHVQQYSFGPYVDRIGTFTAAGANGWLYFVDGVQPSAAAGNYNLKTNDSVVWYFGNVNSTTTTSTNAPSTTSSGGANSTTTTTATTTATSTLATSTITAATSTSPVIGEVLGASTTAITSAAGNSEVTLLALEQELATLEFKVNSCSFQFNKNLQRGMNNADVKNLQTTLDYIPMFIGGSTIPTTGYFGSVTEAAVIAFQNLWSGTILAPNGMTTGNGFVGASTRAVLNGLCETSSTASAN
jgi:hypothetical protein